MGAQYLFVDKEQLIELVGTNRTIELYTSHISSKSTVHLIHWWIDNHTTVHAVVLLTMTTSSMCLCTVSCAIAYVGEGRAFLDAIRLNQVILRTSAPPNPHSAFVTREYHADSKCASSATMFTAVLYHRTR